MLLLALGVIAWWGWDYRRERRFDSCILAAARRYQVDPALVKAVVWRESRFDPDARGRAGELGLMQIRAAAAEEWAAAEHIAGFEHRACLDPATNTLAGAWYLKKLLLRYKDTDNPAGVRPGRLQRGPQQRPQVAQRAGGDAERGLYGTDRVSRHAGVCARDIEAGGALPGGVIFMLDL